jgi:hypothetical protein
MWLTLAWFIIESSLSVASRFVSHLGVSPAFTYTTSAGHSEADWWH